MGKLRDLQRNAHLLVTNWQRIRSESLEETKSIALDIISDDQLFKFGIDGTGKKLAPYRNPVYAAFKTTLNPNQVTDLRLTGSFLDGLFGIVKGDDIFTDSTDQKAGMLDEKYGPDHLSMTKENTGRYAQEAVLPVLQDLTRKALF